MAKKSDKLEEWPEQNLVNEVHSRISQTLRAKQIIFSEGPLWVEGELKKGRHDRTTGTFVEDMVGLLADRYLKQAAKYQRSPLEKSSPREARNPAWGLTVATRKKLFPQVEKLRGRIFNNVDAPFPPTEGGNRVAFTRAWEWFKAQCDQEVRAGTAQPSGICPAFRAKQRGELRQVPLGGLIHDLWLQVSELALETKWLEPVEVLEYVLTDTLPVPGVQFRWVNMPRKSIFGYSPDELEGVVLTLTARGPATAEQILEAYQRACEQERLVAKSLSERQRKALELRSDYPSLTWAKLYELHWKPWIEQNPQEKDFKGTGRKDKRLHELWSEAVKRAGWRNTWE